MPPAWFRAHTDGAVCAGPRSGCRVRGELQDEGRTLTSPSRVGGQVSPVGPGDPPGDGEADAAATTPTVMRRR